MIKFFTCSLIVYILIISGCMTAGEHRSRADTAAKRILQEKKVALGLHTENLSIEKPSETLRKRLLINQNLLVSGNFSYGSHYLTPPENWPEDGYPNADKIQEKITHPEFPPLTLSIQHALEAGASNSPEYQNYKEEMFKAALDLNLEQHAFDGKISGSSSGEISSDTRGTETVSGVTSDLNTGFEKQLRNGLAFTAGLALDLVKLLTQGRNSSFGITFDSSVSIPLLRGSGRHIRMESLTRAERNVVNRIYEFKRFQKNFTVDIIERYLNILEQYQRTENFYENYKSLGMAAKKSETLKDAGRIIDIDLDRARQDQLRAQEKWLTSIKTSKNSLDSFKIKLGIPPDARIELNKKDLDRIYGLYLKELEMQSDFNTVDPSHGLDFIQKALNTRMDLKVAISDMEDAQRNIIVLADALGAELTLLGSANTGESRSLSSAGQENASLSSKGLYSALLTLDLPFERTAQRHAYRNGFITLERSIRRVQILEDNIKLSVREKLRDLEESEERLKIQYRALQLAKKRVKSTALFYEAGRAELKDILDAQESLLSSRNNVAAAAIDLVSAKLELLREIGMIDPGTVVEMNLFKLGSSQLLSDMKEK